MPFFGYQFYLRYGYFDQQERSLGVQLLRDERTVLSIDVSLWFWGFEIGYGTNEPLI
jgi:hypothetical protein